MTCGVSKTDACKIGAVGPGGGWIFFVDYNDQYAGFDYLEAAATDVPDVAWCNITSTSIYDPVTPTVTQNWVNNRVGLGSVNTIAMKQVCSSGAAYSATSYDSQSTPALSDWFLGSEGEMMLMYTNLRQAGVGGFAFKGYWSSTEYSRTYAWSQSFFDGGQYSDTKSYNYPVRPIRAFSYSIPSFN